jgi:hypothetical protein
LNGLTAQLFTAPQIAPAVVDIGLIVVGDLTRAGKTTTRAATSLQQLHLAEAPWRVERSIFKEQIFIYYLIIHPFVYGCNCQMSHNNMTFVTR